MTAAHDHSLLLGTYRPSAPKESDVPAREPAPDETRAGFARRPQPRSK